VAWSEGVEGEGPGRSWTEAGASRLACRAGPKKIWRWPACRGGMFPMPSRAMGMDGVWEEEGGGTDPRSRGKA
jgi:hypothetical protein